MKGELLARVAYFYVGATLERAVRVGFIGLGWDSELVYAFDPPPLWDLSRSPTASDMAQENRDLELA